MFRGGLHSLGTHFILEGKLFSIMLCTCFTVRLRFTLWRTFTVNTWNINKVIVFFDHGLLELKINDLILVVGLAFHTFSVIDRPSVMSY